jgi:hypothetical protein
VGYFYTALSPYGNWVFLPGYGYVWQPGGVGYGWRPYTNGHWVWTDYGWTWVSGYNWGWAPFHYGRWAYTGGGWYWVPGTAWGPAWVSWRTGPGYVGWAPLPPSAAWRPGVGLARFDEREINERSYVFVPQRNLTAVNLNQHIEVETRNQTLLRGTQSATSYTTEGGRVVNRGIPVERFERETGQVVHRHTLADSASAGGARISGNQVEMYRPKLSDATPKNPPPGVQRGTRADSSVESTRKQDKIHRNADTNQQVNQQNQAKQQRQIQAQQEQDRLNRDKQQRKIQAQQDQQRLNQEKQQRKADRQAQQDQARRQQKQERKQQRQNQSTPPNKDKNKNTSS